MGGVVPDEGVASRRRVTGRTEGGVHFALAFASAVVRCSSVAVLGACATVSGLSDFSGEAFSFGDDAGGIGGQDAVAVAVPDGWLAPQDDATADGASDTHSDAAPASDVANDGTVRDAPGGDGTGGAEGASPDARAALPTLTSTNEVCKLISNTSQSDPTPNQAQTRANLLGADLGIPVDSAGTLYLFFGDSWGYKGIWQPGQSFPDAVGHALDSTSAVTATPTLLCSDLRFLALSPSSSVGPTIDSSVVADFAAGAMTAPSGGSLSDYVHNPSGGGGTTFPNLPGSFEVPSGGFASGGAVYIFYTTVNSTSDLTMVASYLAKWSTPATSGIPNYQILYHVDERVDSASPMHGDFVNIAADTANGYVYMFGTGAYRASSVHLARKSLSTLATAGGFELYDAASGTWGGTSEGAPIINVPGYGETSVRYFASINRWMFLAEELYSGHNQIVARFADRPEGPWSSAVVVHDMANPVFLATYCCGSNGCTGQQLFAGCGTSSGGAFYGSYLLPGLTVNPNGSFTVTYTMSTWNLYNVALMQATFD
jgi:hypothetical protein